MHSPTKIDFRLVRRTYHASAVCTCRRAPSSCSAWERPPGPRKFEDPHEFRPDRKNVREHIAFGKRDPHVCRRSARPRGGADHRAPNAGSHERHSHRRSVHGPADSRDYTYEPTFLLRGLTQVAHRVHTVGLDKSCAAR